MMPWLATLLALTPVAAAAAPVACDPAASAPVDQLDKTWWATRHTDLLAQIARRPDPEVLLIGDSITQNYEKSKAPDENFQPTWQRFYAPRRALNLGFSGDTTVNLLWRLRHGEIDGIAPKVAVMLIGTNDTAQGRNAEKTVCGVHADVAEIKRRLPDTRILLIGVLPSDISPAKSATDAAVNAGLAAQYAEDPRVTYLDIGAAFQRGGMLDTSIFYDPRLADRHARALHPDTIGQARMAEAIEPTLAAMLHALPR